VATLNSYIERMPFQLSRRYLNNARYWVGWANSLLERMSGMGVLRPKRRMKGVTVYNRRWVALPFGCRDVLELRHPVHQQRTYPFEEVNGALRLMNLVREDYDKKEFELIRTEADRLIVTPLGDNLDDWDGNVLKDWLCVVTDGKRAGQAYVVESNVRPEPGNAAMEVRLKHYPYVEDWITRGYFIPPETHLVMTYIEAYRPIESVDDRFALSGYDNLIETWLRWKAEEHEQSASHECEYWRSRVDAELQQLRGEAFNRVNRSPGRRLPGFGGEDRPRPKRRGDGDGAFQRVLDEQDSPLGSDWIDEDN
jgi:hypothetical protein